MDRSKDKALSLSLKYLGYKMRTEKEIKEYLYKKKFSDEDISYALEKLRDYKYINDTEFTELWIRDRYNFLNHGKYRIKNDLTKKGVSKELIDEKIDGFFTEEKEIEKIRELYKKKNPKNQELTEKELFSICNYIFRRGFPGGLVRKIVFKIYKNTNFDQS